MIKDVPSCLGWNDGEPMQHILEVANVVAENSSATNGQVMDILVATCAAIIEHFPRNDDILASFSVRIGDAPSLYYS